MLCKSQINHSCGSQNLESLGFCAYYIEKCNSNEKEVGPVRSAEVYITPAPRYPHSKLELNQFNASPHTS